LPSYFAARSIALIATNHPSWKFATGKAAPSADTVDKLRSFAGLTEFTDPSTLCA
jgi:hypothetical protein